MVAIGLRRLAYLLTIIIIAGQAVYAVTLEWEIKKGDRLEMVKTAAVKHLVNSQPYKQYEERDIVNLTCYDEGAGSSKVKGDFSIYQRENPAEVFEKAVLLEKHDSDFVIESTGRFQVKKGDYMPNLRHIPTFPPGDVKKGDKWKGDAEMLFNSFSAPFKLVFPAEYTLQDLKKEGGDDIAVIHYTFQFDKTVSDPKAPPDFPKKVAAKNTGVFRWNVTKKTPGVMDDRYAIVFMFQGPGNYASLMSQEFHMTIHTENKTYRVMSDKEKETEKDALAKEISKDSGIVVSADKRGLVLTLGDVHFDFDSFELKSDSRDKLNGVAAVIAKKYPDHELLVEGHTDGTGDPYYNMKLSVKRARTVAGYMKKSVGHDKISFQGFGDKKPVSDNVTAEGKRKNRRVEIVIKLD